jgi:putative copper export protein
LFVAGLALTVLLLGSLAALASPYGRLLLVKIGAFALLMIFASLNKWRLAPRIARGEKRALILFRYSVLAEWLLIAAVLSVTAVMTSLYSPSSD